MHRSFGALVRVAVVVASFQGIRPLAAQSPRVLSKADYDRAVRFLGGNLGGLVVGGNVQARWLSDGRFWYTSTTLTGSEQVVVDPVRRTRTKATEADTAGSRTTEVGGGGITTRGGGGPRTGGAAGVLSPDGKRAAFIKDWNLWVRDVATKQERQLTTDGVKNFGYATDNAGWAKSDRAILKWSPDSRKIATQQQDERQVGDMYLLETRVGQPILHTWKYSFSGDSIVPMIHRVIIDVDAGRVIRLKMPPDFHRATYFDDILMSDYNWSPDGSRLALASVTRDHRTATLKLADAATGDVRTVMSESTNTHYESRTGWQVLWPTNEVIWYSQRDDWGQLYLYDLNTGALKRKITSGEGPVTQIVRIDEQTRTLWYQAKGRERGQDPYFAHYYRIGLDGGDQVSLTPDDGDHSIQLSPSGQFLVDTYSKPDVPPVVALRDRDGKLVMPLEKADISRLVATGWKPPISITMKAHDGKTDLYGLMFRPTNFDSTRKYPIINNIYPGPFQASAGSRKFTAARGDRQALAELGFVVVAIDGMGTEQRSKSFHDAYYGAMGRDNTLPSQIAGMKDLARRYPWIDIDRVGIYGHSGGGFAAADAMFRFGDFFKVGISESGNHDQRLYEDDFGERYQGPLVRNSDKTDNYAAEANQNQAKNLRGKLLLMTGTLDYNVPPDNTYLVVDALIKANKDFDLLIIPNGGHAYGSASNYVMRRRWDYFVRGLLNADPPKEYAVNPGGGGRGAGRGND
jgi:dipeptidyl-peptidase-4